jgi:hypothetical protein
MHRHGPAHTDPQVRMWGGRLERATEMTSSGTTEKRSNGQGFDPFTDNDVRLPPPNTTRRMAVAINVTHF